MIPRSMFLNLRGLLRLRDQYEHLFAGVIAEGIGDKTLEKTNVSLAAKTLLGGLNGVSAWYRPRPD
jgi:Tetracyclin repressor-like, C-terminal domain